MFTCKKYSIKFLSALYQIIKNTLSQGHEIFSYYEFSIIKINQRVLFVGADSEINFLALKYAKKNFF